MTTPSATHLQRTAQQVAGALPALVIAAQHLAASVQMGSHGRRRAGAGDDFWQYRPAQVGDPARRIDWRRSARADTEYVRDREWQASQALYLWSDTADSMWFTDGDRPQKAERAQVLALALGVLALGAGERVGLARIDMPARTGRAHIGTLASGMGDVHAPDPAGIAAHARAVFFSDFMADTGSVEHALSVAAGKGVRGVLVQVLDPVEEDFPYQGRTLFHAMSGPVRFETREAGDLRARYLDRLAARRAHLAQCAADAGWQFVTHRTDSSPLTTLLWLHAALEQGA